MPPPAQVTGVDEAVAGVAPVWVRMKLTAPADVQVKVAWIVIVVVGAPLVSGETVMRVEPGVKAVTATPTPPVAVAVWKVPGPEACRMPAAPAGVFV